MADIELLIKIPEDVKLAFDCAESNDLQGMNVTEIINIIHKQGVENEVFELLTQWMIEDRYNKMKKIAERENKE